MHFVCFLIEKGQKYYILCLGNLHMSEKSCNFALALRLRQNLRDSSQSPV